MCNVAPRDGENVFPFFSIFSCFLIIYNIHENSRKCLHDRSQTYYLCATKISVINVTYEFHQIASAHVQYNV